VKKGKEQIFGKGKEQIFRIFSTFRYLERGKNIFIIFSAFRYLERGKRTDI